MSGCTDLDMYLNRGLSSVETREFERHLSRCDHCRIGVERWQAVRSELLGVMAESIPNITEFGAVGLVHRAQLQQVGSHNAVWRRPLAWVGLGAVAAAALLVFWVIAPKDVSSVSDGQSAPAISHRTETPSETLPADLRDERREDQTSEIPTITETGTSVEIGHARIALADAGRVQVERSDAKQTRLKLLSGTVAVDLPHAAGREALSIEAGEYSVSVVGTRFWVERTEEDSIAVGVERGVVRVTGPDGATAEVRQGRKLLARNDGVMTVEAVSDEEQARMGRLLTIDSLLADSNAVDTDAGEAGLSRRQMNGKSVANDVPPSLEEIKRWVISGELQKSERALTQHLRRNPVDVEALSLLASCLRKAGKYDESIRAYQRLMSVGSPVEQYQARFKAGALLQDRMGRHQEAATYFETYLEAPPSVRANTVEARIRLAQSLHALGRDSQYRSLLTLIVREHGGTEAAVKAARALEALGE